MNPKEKLQALLNAVINTTGESDTTLTNAVQRLVDGYGQGDITLPGKTVVITGATDVYVGDVGDYGYAILLDADSNKYGYSNCVFALAWNPATSNLNFLAVNPTKAGGYESRTSASYHGSYDTSTHTITFLDYSATHGVWQFIPYTN